MSQEEFSKTRSANKAERPCENDCCTAMEQIQAEVDDIKSIQNAIERNGAITAAYHNLAQDMPNNLWVRLASYVSAQAGCAMQTIQGCAAQTIGRFIVNPGEALDMFKQANTTIFESVYPPNKFMHEHGFERLQECVDAGAIDVPPDLMEAFEDMHEGQIRDAANAIAQYEQETVIEPLYQENAGTFADLQSADWWAFWGDQSSIPISYACTRSNLVSLGDLNLANSQDRISYYHRLMDEMLRLEGLQP